MEDCFNKRISIQSKIKIDQPSIINHHTSVQYRASFFSKNPIFRRTSNSQMMTTQKINKEEIFSLVFRFIGKIVTNSSYLDQVLKSMKFDNQDKNISVTKISDFDSEVQNSSNSICSSGNVPQTQQTAQLSERQINISAPKIQILQVHQEKANPKKEVRQAKISIMVGSYSDFSLGSGSRISCSSSIKISSIKFPPHILTLEMVRTIFQQPQPFLINLALCLMLKFLFYSKMTITGANSSWILSIATIVAYKIYYDDPIGGLIQSFTNILQINSHQIMDLQRYFLDQISFQAVITSEQYHQMLSKIISTDP